jgi:type I restriction enzyme R subunit
MTGVGQPESATQRRVITLFREELGYRYLGDWTDRVGNANIDQPLLTAYLTKSGYTAAQISAAI